MDTRVPSSYNDCLIAEKAEPQACRDVLRFHRTMLQNNCTLHGCQRMDGRLGSIARSQSSIFKAYPRDQSIQILPTLGPKDCKYYLHWAIWIPREREATVYLVRAVAKELCELEAAKSNEVNDPRGPRTQIVGL